MTTDARAPRALPRLAATLLTSLLPHAERDEVLAELAGEHALRRRRDGTLAARRWLWRQVLASLPALARRTWWRGRTGFEPPSSRWRPGGPALESWILDARYAARFLRSRPGFTLLAVATLALGVGGTAAVSTIAGAFLRDPLPYLAEDELMVLWAPGDWSTAEHLALRGDYPGFSEVAAYSLEDLTLQRGDEPALRVSAVAASSELFAVLGREPLLGRSLRAGDDAPGAEPVVVLSHAFWRDLGGDRGLVGGRLRIDGIERTVAGVMPPDFWFPDPSVKVWFPYPMDPENRSGNLTMIGRRAPGVTADALTGPLAALAERLDERFDYPEQWDKTRLPSATALRETLVGGARPALLATLGAMVAILVMAGANVAALMLGQVGSRSTELAVRAALGAPRSRLLRQLLAEAILLGGLAGLAGAAVAVASFRLLMAALPLGPAGEAVVLGGRVLATSLVLAVVTALAVALVPMLRLGLGRLSGILAGSHTRLVARGGRLEAGLVVAEVALAVVLAAGAGLLVRSVLNLRAIDPGFDPRRVAVVDVVLPADLPNPGREQVLADLRRELATLPGVRGAAAIQKLPLRGDGWSSNIAIEGRPDLAVTTTYFRIVTPGYFATMGLDVTRGRSFTESDGERAEPVAVINETLARSYFGDDDPVGRRISHGMTSDWTRVVGVVEDEAVTGLLSAAAPTRYVLYEQMPFVPSLASLVLATAEPATPEAILPAARRLVERRAPGVAVSRTTTMDRVVAEAMGPTRHLTRLLAFFGALALVLAAVGVYGVVAHWAGRRTREWGLRMALGLRPGRVVTRVLSRTTALVAAGVALGLGATLALDRALASFLYGVGRADPLAFGAASAVLLTAGLLAAVVPAFRAGRSDPAAVLRES